MWVLLVVVRDHPREYGENSWDFFAASCEAGSSPRIRGEYPELVGNHGHHGIIPANTGRMSRRGVAPRVSWDHPREYGENFGKG